jgi:hypothetical protein
MKPWMFPFLKRGPIQCFFLAFLLALIYTVLPNLNFWFYNLCKQQFWAICAVIQYTEVQEIALPDASDTTYRICYIIAIFIPSAIHVSSYFTTARNNDVLNYMDVTTSYIFVMGAYFLDAYRNPILPVNSTGRDTSTDELGVGRVSSVLFDLYDTFDLALSASEATAVVVGSVRSMELRNGSQQLDDCPGSEGPPNCQLKTQPHQSDFEGASRCRAKFIVTHDWLMAQRFRAQQSNLDATPASVANPIHEATDMELGRTTDMGSLSLRVRDPRISFGVGPTPLHRSPDSRQSTSTGAVGVLRIVTSRAEHGSVQTVGDSSSVRGGNTDQYTASRISCEQCTDSAIVAPTETKLPCVCPYLYFPRDTFQSELGKGVVFVDRRRQAWLVAAFNVLFNAYYYFLIFFTEYFRDNAISSYRRVLLFGFYIAVGTVFRTVMKRLGLLIDRGKSQTTSMLFVGEVMCLLFYYTFYRVLFESISSWSEFFIFQAVHLFSEWMMYPFRASHAMYERVRWLEERLGLNGTFLPCGLNQQDWLCFIALDFGIRCTVMVATGVGIGLLMIVIAYTPWITNSLKLDQYQLRRSIEFILLAVVLEIINAVAMNHMFFSKNGMDVISKVSRCFAQRRFFFVACMLAAGLLMNPVYAFTTNNVWTNK